MSQPFKTFLVLDFETRWDSKEYTLKKLTTEQYIRHPDFKAFGVCVKNYDVPGVVWVTHADLPDFFAAINWSETAVLAHNAQFDIAILSWIYGCNPAFIFDSLSMARALRGVEVGNSLFQLAKDFGFPPKGQAIHSTDGLADLPENIEAELSEYCKHDTWLCEEIFKKLLPNYPAKELRLIDMTLRMFINPTLELDKEILENAIEKERANRTGLLSRLDVQEPELASNEKFADILRRLGIVPPTKISKTTGEKTLALAKNDAHFQALLSSDREDVVALCEARLAVKSTLERTRAERFLDIARRGRLPVPLNYYGAHTGRWSASKGSGLNLQNLKRGSFLRQAIRAPDGYQLVVCDLAQIEPRVLAWLCDYVELLNIFASGRDAYAQFGAQMFGIPGLSKDSHPDLRQSAKSALLGCFGPDTKVLTRRGWIPIVRVQATDTLWDGEKWVTHQGVVPQGEKEVLTAYGISATLDHEILTEHGWVEWNEVLTKRSLLESALSLANLPVLDGNADHEAISGSISTRINQKCGAHAGGKVLLNAPILEKDVQLAVTTAQRKKPTTRAWLNLDMKRYARTERTVKDFSTESAQLLSGALIQIQRYILIMVDEALQFIRRGLKIVSNFYGISYRLMAGTNHSYNLIGPTTIGDMNPEIYVSLREAQTCQTNAKLKQEMLKVSSSASLFLKQKMQTYDIVYAGPKNRYTVLTDCGPIIVHNCGYGLGWASFSAQLLTGFLGAPPTLYDKKFARQLGVTAEDVNSFISYEPFMERMREIPHTCEQNELIVHCVSAKLIIDKYREAATPVKNFWEMCDALIKRSLVEGREYMHKCLVFAKERILLPSGLALRYPNLTGRPDEKGRMQWQYGGDEKKLYGGKLTENIVQAVARCIMTDGMLRIQKRYPCVLTVHDECCIIVPENEAEDAYKFVLKCMTTTPKYMPGLPLAAEGGFGKRYGDIK